MILGEPLPKRLELLRRLEKGAAQETEQVKFQGQLKHFPIRTVPIQLPKYRLANGRTQAAQEEFLATNADKYPSDFFTKDLESDDAQLVQHQILEGMVNEENLLAYFRKERQEYPLILTADGFVLNGNRRLCAFRKLYEENKDTYAHFKDVQVVILPESDERALDSLEAHLQITRDIRSDYSWVTMAVMYRKRTESGEFTPEEIGAVQGIPEDEITKSIDMLAYAEEYLEFRGTPKQYRYLTSGRGGGDSKLAFEQLIRTRKKVKGAPQRKTILERVAYALIEDPKGRSYASIPAAGEYLDQIIEALSEQFADELSSESGGSGEMESLLGSGTENIDNLVSVLSNHDNADAVRDVAVDVIRMQEDIDTERKRKNAVFNQIKKANALLTSAKNGIDERTSKAGIVQQLQTAQTTINDLMRWATE